MSELDMAERLRIRAEVAREIAAAITERRDRFADQTGRFWEGRHAGFTEAAETATLHAMPPEVRAAMDDAMDAAVFGTGAPTGGPRGILAALHSGEDPLP